jgi:hypothetical protein
VITHHYLERDALMALLAEAGFAQVELLRELPDCDLPEGQLFYRCAAVP